VQMFKKICGYLTGRIRGKLYQIKLKKNIQSLHNQ